MNWIERGERNAYELRLAKLIKMLVAVNSMITVRRRQR